MSICICTNCGTPFDSDHEEQAEKCRFCFGHEVIADTRDVPWTIRIMIGETQVGEMDATFCLVWDDHKGWCFNGVIVDDLDGGDPLRIERDGTIRLNDGWRQHSPMASAIRVSAEYTFDCDVGAITADLPIPVPAVDPDYTDPRHRHAARQRRVA